MMYLIIHQGENASHLLRKLFTGRKNCKCQKTIVLDGKLTQESTHYIQPLVYGLQRPAWYPWTRAWRLCTAVVNSSCVSLGVPGILTTLFTFSTCRLQHIKRVEHASEI